jgi:flagellar basal body-associated protein FliL
MKQKLIAIRHRFRATRKKVILFILMFFILTLLIAGIIITLWYTFGEKLDQNSEVPPYVSTAACHNKEVC